MIPEEYADQYWAWVDAENENWFNDEPLTIDEIAEEDLI